MAHMAATKTTMMVHATGISESQIKGWQSCSLTPRRTLSSDEWASDVHCGSTAASSPAPSAPMPLQPS